jgi:tRNA threonylcarbamoyladenosine biosynthesis protein TsaE
MITVRVSSLEQTAGLARALASRLRPGDVLCLDGELGAGKTAFVKELATVFGADDEINSPTFTLENRHRLEGDGPGLLVHCDLYRPGEDARRDLLPSMLEARDEGALLAIEWADPVRDWLTPYLQITVRLFTGGNGPQREFSLEPVPEGWPAMDEVSADWRRIEEAS